MLHRRLLLKRLTVCTATVVLLLAGYLAGAPIVLFAVAEYAPAAQPAMEIIYAPIGYAMEANVPGTDAYFAYIVWCLEALGAEVAQ